MAAVRKGDDIRLFVNGALSAGASTPPGRSFDLTNTSPLRIGCGAQCAFDGYISDLRLYSGALSAEQAGEVHARGRHSS